MGMTMQDGIDDSVFEMPTEESPELSLDEPIIEVEDKLEYRDDSPNLVVDFAMHPDGVKALEEMARQVCDDFDKAWDGHKEYRERLAADYKLFAGELPEKNYPFKNAANPHVPLTLENACRLVFRMSHELFGDWSSVFGVVPIGAQDESTADILTKHGNWQIRNQMTDFRRQMMRGLFIYVMAGDVTSCSSWDYSRKRNRHDILTADEFVVPYTMVSMEPDYSDVPFKVQVLRYHRHEMQAMDGIWQNVQKVLEREPPPWESDPDQPMRDSAGEASHIEVPDADKHTPYKLLQYEGWTHRLPGQTVDRFVKVVVDYTTKHVLHLSIHEEEDWQDRIRYEREMAELAQYREQRLAYDAAADAYAQQDLSLGSLVQSETAGDYEKAEANYQLDELRQMAPPPMPVAPVWMDPSNPDSVPAPIKTSPINMYAHAVCVEPMTGVCGISYGRILTDLNRAANVALSQFSDSAHLNNIWSLIVGSDFAQDEAIEIAPGKVNRLASLTGAQIKEAIMELRPGPPSPALLDIVERSVNMAQSAVQAPSVMSGEPGKSGETYRGHSSRLEQATLQLSVVTRGFADFFEQILKNNAKLNSYYLKDEEIVNISGQPGMMAEDVAIKRDMYRRDYRVEFRSDLRFTSMQQRVAEADELVALWSNNPFLQMNAALGYQVMKKAMQARGRFDLIKYLGEPPAPPPVFGAPTSPPAPPPGMAPGMPGGPPAGAPADGGANGQQGRGGLGG